MLELLADGGNYIAILALCVSCWIGGSRVRTAHASPADETDPLIGGEADAVLLSSTLSGSAPSGLAQSGDCNTSRRSAPSSKAFPDGAVQHVHDLIRTGDLSQEGVIESLVAMAEEQEATDPFPARRAAPPMQQAPSAAGAPSLFPKPVIQERPDRSMAWLNLSDRTARSGKCMPPTILKRVGSAEPLPARMDNPLSQDVLARYRLFAEECAPITGS